MVNECIVYCKQRQKDRPDLRQHLSYMSYCKEHQTIKFSVPRQSGHSTAMLHLMKKYPNAMTIFPKYRFVELFGNEVPELKDRMYAIDQITTYNKLQGLDKYDMTIVDMTACISNNDLDRIYEKTGHLNTKPDIDYVYVFLQ